jgi:hypothetical protein
VRGERGEYERLLSTAKARHLLGYELQFGRRDDVQT